MEALAPWHLLIIALAAFLLFFGWKQLPDMSRSLGRSLRIFKTEIKGMAIDDQARALQAELANTAADTRTELTETAAALRSGQPPAATPRVPVR